MACAKLPGAAASARVPLQGYYAWPATDWDDSGRDYQGSFCLAADTWYDDVVFGPLEVKDTPK